MSTPRSFRRALVTGASGGIGEAMAHELAERGSHVVLVARSREKMETLAAELRGHPGVEIEVLPADLTEAGDLAVVEDRLRRTDAPVDLLVNNAGMGQVGSFGDLDVDGAEQQIRLNVLAPVRLAHAVLPRLRSDGGGILNVSSIAAAQPVPSMATYAGTKAFLTSWSQALHEELRGTGVHVTALAPGFTRTGFVDSAEAQGEASLIPGFIWSSAAAVARVGLDGVAADRGLVVPGPLYRAGVTMADLTPSSITRRVVGFTMRQVRR
jgi:uncharacterized protein